MTTGIYTADQIKAIGGNEWKRPGTDEIRIYLNDLTILGFDINYYKSGNICGATLNGRRISNGKATRATCAKIYWTSTTGQIRIDQGGGLFDLMSADEVLAAIDDAVRAAEPQPEQDDNDDTQPPASPASGIVASLREAGNTVRQITEMVGVSISTIYRWARGICRPRTANLTSLLALA